MQKNLKKMPKGSIVALVTPFDKYGKVDCKQLKRLVAWQEKNGTQGIVVFGTTGESPTLSAREKRLILKTCLEAKSKDTFIFAGSGSNDTFEAIKNAKEFSQMGADGLLVVTPYYNLPNDDGMLKHFLAVAESSLRPVVVYNVPNRTGCNLSLSIAEKLAKQENILGIKEASGNLSFASKLMAKTQKDWVLYCGNDNLVLPYLAIGASGVVSVWANASPRVVSKLVQSWFLGKTEEAKNLQLSYLEFVEALFCQPNPIPIKAVLNLLGIKVGCPRLPLGVLTKKESQKIEEVIKKAGVKNEDFDIW